MDRKQLESSMAALIAARASMDGIIKVAFETILKAEAERRPLEMRVDDVIDKTTRARVAVADAILAVREAFASAGIRPT